MNVKRLIAILVAVALTACTTMRPMDASRAELDAELEPEDHLVVYESSGRIIDMTFIEFDGDTLRGRLTDGSEGPISTELADIEKLEIEKIDGAKTTIAVVGTAVVLIPVVLAAGAVSLMSGM